MKNWVCYVMLKLILFAAIFGGVLAHALLREELPPKKED